MAKIFVFGSNLDGIHGSGSAKHAFKYCGAIYGQGIGLQGTSYAIPTKKNPKENLPLYEINVYVAQFIEYAIKTPENDYEVVAIGCGLAGYLPIQIAPMFFYAQNIPNIHLPKSFINNLKALDDFIANRESLQDVVCL